MKKRNFSVVLFILITLNVLTVIGQPRSDILNNSIGSFNDFRFHTIKKIIEFSDPDLTTNSEYCTINIHKATSYLSTPGFPQLPKVTTHFELPYGVVNVDVEFTPYNLKKQDIPKDIVPASRKLPLTSYYDHMVESIKKDENVYSSSKLFPSYWYSYFVGCGINEHFERVTHLLVDIYPIRYNPGEKKIYSIDCGELDISYEKIEIIPSQVKSGYDLVIIAPKGFSKDINRLIEHKNKVGITSIYKSTEDIFLEYNGVDNPEKIKYFIKEAIESLGIKYVLLVGGLNSQICAKPRDNRNEGSKNWYVPVRYSNLYDKYGNSPVYDPGFLCDLYYADIYKVGAEFDDWDSNDDGVFAARNCPGIDDDILDLYPDVYVGRLPCRNRAEVQSMVDKIISYENMDVDSSWFHRAVAIAGDGLQDQKDLDVQWNVRNLSDGIYTIYAQSRSHFTGEWGSIDTISVKIDHSIASSINFSEDDHLRINEYPGPAIAEITSPSSGDILGNTDIDYVPRNAYGETYWTNVTFVEGIMHIRGKSYDPRPYGVITDIKFWIENESGEIVFTHQKNNTKVYFDCEWTTGNNPLGGGRAGGLYYIPNDFEKIYLWASNGNFKNQQDVIETISKGCGFVFFFGHSNPNLLAVNLPGMPGGKGKSSITALSPISLQAPLFPMNKLSNIEKLPIVIVLGCHNSQFNITLLTSILDQRNMKKTWTYGFPTLECWSWWLTKIPHRGAIATIGCTGLGYGSFMDGLIPDTGCWIYPEFFRQYGEIGQQFLGDAHGQAITSYLNAFGQYDLLDAKTAQEFTLFGDPSLRIGGYT